jgi:hypothetical protein
MYLSLLTLAVAGLTTDDPQTLRTAYNAMGIFADTLIIPISIAILVTGVALGLGTKWGLLTYYWVTTKLVLTLFVAMGSIFGLRLRIAEAIDGLPADPTATDAVGDAGGFLVFILPVALGIYITATVLSYYKPWGRIRGDKTRAARRARRMARAEEA